jgi:hypothetical protein
MGNVKVNKQSSCQIMYCRKQRGIVDEPLRFISNNNSDVKRQRQKKYNGQQIKYRKAKSMGKRNLTKL